MPISLTAVARLAERHVRLYGATPEIALLDELCRYGIDRATAELGLRRALLSERLARSPDTEGPRVLRAATTTTREAA